MSIKTLKKKLKKVGINVTKVTRTGKRLPLTEKELKQKENKFKRLQILSKKKNIRITYKSKDGSRKYKSYKRLISDLKKSKAKSKFGSSTEGFDPAGRSAKLYSKKEIQMLNDYCRTRNTYPPGVRNFCQNDLYCLNLKKTKDQGLIGYKYADPSYAPRLRDFMMDDSPGCIPIYDTSANAYNAFHGPTPMMSRELDNTLVNSHIYFNTRNISENRAIDRIRGIRYNRGLSRHNAPPPIQRQTPARFGG